MSQGNCQWSPEYLSALDYEDEIEKGDVFIIRGGGLIACITINHVQDASYNSVSWREESASAPSVIHRLAIHPEFQSRGLGKKLMRFAEDIARTRGSKSIRLDTFVGNEMSNKFYQSLSYTKVGSVLLKNMPDKCVCYEKIL